MKIAGVLEAGVASGILTKAKYIQGGYIVAANPTEVATIPTGVLVVGTPLYISSENKSYRWNGSTWVEEKILLDAPSDTKLYVRKDGAWFELVIDSIPTSDSTNLVTSGGVKKAIDNSHLTTDGVTDTVHNQLLNETLAQLSALTDVSKVYSVLSYVKVPMAPVASNILGTQNVSASTSTQNLTLCCLNNGQFYVGMNYADSKKLTAQVGHTYRVVYHIPDIASITYNSILIGYWSSASNPVVRASGTVSGEYVYGDISFTSGESSYLTNNILVLQILTSSVQTMNISGAVIIDITETEVSADFIISNFTSLSAGSFVSYNPNWKLTVNGISPDSNGNYNVVVDPSMTNFFYKDMYSSDASDILVGQYYDNLDGSLSTSASVFTTGYMTAYKKYLTGTVSATYILKISGLANNNAVRIAFFDYDTKAFIGVNAWGSSAIVQDTTTGLYYVIVNGGYANSSGAGDILNNYSKDKILFRLSLSKDSRYSMDVSYNNYPDKIIYKHGYDTEDAEDLAILQYNFDSYKSSTNSTISSIQTSLGNLGIGSQWASKSWVAFGTSITATNNTLDPNGNPTGKYAPFLVSLSNLILTNHGIAGGSINNHILYYISYYAADEANADLVTIEGGVNDWAGSCPLGAVGDTVPYQDDGHLDVGGTINGTFAGSCYQCLVRAQANAPHAQIVVITDNTGTAYSDHFNCSRDQLNTLGLKQIDYTNMLVAVAKYVGVKVIDAGRESRISQDTPFYLVDQIHQTYIGGKQYANTIWSELKNISLFVQSV